MDHATIPYFAAVSLRRFAAYLWLGGLRDTAVAFTEMERKRYEKIVDAMFSDAGLRRTFEKNWTFRFEGQSVELFLCTRKQSIAKF